jgi:hypothetical protein
MNKSELNEQVAIFLGHPVSRKDKSSSYYKMYIDEMWIAIRVSDHSPNPWNCGSVDHWIRLYCGENTIDDLKSELKKIVNSDQIILDRWNDEVGSYQHIMKLTN